MYKLMNKRRTKQLTRLVILLGIAIPSFIILGKNIAAFYKIRLQRFFVPTHVSCVLHDISVMQLRSEILSYVSLALAKESLINVDQGTFFRRLKQKFPVVKEVEWNLSASHVLQVIVRGIKPYCTVNGHYILGDQPRLLLPTYFSDADKATLPNITIDPALIKFAKNPAPGQRVRQGQSQEIEAQELHQRLYKFIHKIPPHMWESFHITYRNPFAIELIPHRLLCSCKIIADAQSFFDDHKWSVLNSIFADLAYQKLITKKMLQSKKPAFALDIRLKSRVIVKFFQPVLGGKGL
jgi:hypothetical protein